ncbi:hypothetical protein HDU97_002260 [Phlyctochytrium planicorne]|nr:hypothetical protein HDU97_002260 [Phlyctochytrium planicorne]
MTALTNLPPEVLPFIAELLPRPGISRLLCTCKKMWDARDLCAHLLFTDLRDAAVLPSLPSIASNGHHIQSLTLNLLSEPLLSIPSGWSTHLTSLRHLVVKVGIVSKPAEDWNKLVNFIADFVSQLPYPDKVESLVWIARNHAENEDFFPNRFIDAFLKLTNIRNARLPFVSAEQMQKVNRHCHRLRRLHITDSPNFNQLEPRLNRLSELEELTVSNLMYLDTMALIQSLSCSDKLRRLKVLFRADSMQFEMMFSMSGLDVRAEFRAHAVAMFPHAEIETSVRHTPVTWNALDPFGTAAGLEDDAEVSGSEEEEEDDDDDEDDDDNERDEDGNELNT